MPQRTTSITTTSNILPPEIDAQVRQMQSCWWASSCQNAINALTTTLHTSSTPLPQESITFLLEAGTDIDLKSKRLWGNVLGKKVNINIKPLQTIILKHQTFAEIPIDSVQTTAKTNFKKIATLHNTTTSVSSFLNSASFTTLCQQPDNLDKVKNTLLDLLSGDDLTALIKEKRCSVFLNKISTINWINCSQKQFQDKLNNIRNQIIQDIPEIPATLNNTNSNPTMKDTYTRVYFAIRKPRKWRFRKPRLWRHLTEKMAI